jgi:hypothetical protein
MRHLKPVSKAELQWFEESPVNILQGLLEIISAIVPMIEAIIAAKGTPETTT